MFVSELLGKNVYVVNDGKALGYVLNVRINDKFSCISKICVVNDDDEYFYLVSTNDIVKINENIFVNKNEFEIVGEDFSEVCINCATVAIDGGESYVKDVMFSLNNFKIKRIELFSGGYILPSRVESYSGMNLIYFKKKSPKVKTTSIEIKTPDCVISKIQAQKCPKIVEPICFEKIIGKKLSKNISLSNGEIIAKKGQVVNTSTIILAKKYGRLADLL